MADEELVRILKEGVEAWHRLLGKRAANVEFWLTNLSDTNLTNADLCHQDLSGAHLACANLTDANLYGANLSGANLRGATLVGTTLSSADLSTANLSGANFRRTVLHGATLYQTDLRGSIFVWTVFADTNLSRVNGLAAAKFNGPCSIDQATLRASRGKIPDSFLRGCGFSDWEVTAARLYDPDLTPDEYIDISYQVADLCAIAPIQPNPIFISYTHSDSRFVDELQEALDEKGIRSWRDIHHAEAGPLDKVIDRAITLNPTMVLVLSEASANSDWVAYEINKAIELEKKLKRPVLCPIALDDSWSGWLSAPHQARLKRYAVLDYSVNNAVKKMMPRLLKGLHIHYRGEAPGE